MPELRLQVPTPPDWPSVQLSKVCDVISRGRAPAYVEDSSIFAIGQRCIQETRFDPSAARAHDKNQLDGVLFAVPGDVLLNSTGTGTIGRSCVFHGQAQRYVVDGHVTLIRPDNKRLDTRWLNAVLQSWFGQRHLENQCYSGSTNQIELSRSRLEASLFPLPPIREQRRVGEILDAADEAIRQTERIIAKLKAMKVGLLHDLLTRGIDKHGRLRVPHAHPDQFKESPLGRIPERWSTDSLGNCSFVTKLAGFEYTDYFDYSKRGEIIAVRVLNIRDGRLDLSDVHTIPRSVSYKLPRSALKPCDLVLSYVGTIGEVALIEENNRFHLAPNVARISPDREMLAPRFLLMQLLGHQAQKRLFDLSTLTSQPALSMGRLRCLQIVLPPLKEQLLIAGIVDAHDARFRAEEAELAKLRQLKRGLMHDLLTGRVRVSSSEALAQSIVRRGQ